MPRRLLLAALAALLPLAGAAAQDSAADAQQDQPATLSAVTVTAEKSNRSLLNTSTSVSVLNQHDLESRAGLATTRDVLANTPNVVLVGTGNTAPTIRGVDGTGAAQGADAFFAGSRPRLNMQTDGRPGSYNEIVFGDSTLWDVDHVEVLLGPQSTLQGRNAIAGTVATWTNNPTYYNEGALRLAGGDYNQRRASAMISGPILADTLAYRFTADYMGKDSFVQGWAGYPGVDDPGHFRMLNLRGKLLFEPKEIPGLRNLLTLNHSEYTGPQTENVGRPFAAHQQNYLNQPVFEPKTSSAILDTQYAISPALNYESLLSATDLNVKRKAQPGAGILNIDGREYMFEPRLRYSGEGRTGAVAGVYLFHSRQDEAIDYPSNEAFQDRITTTALFGEGTLQLSRSVDLIGGTRLEREQHQRHGANVAASDPLPVRIDVDSTNYAFLPKLGLAWHVAPKATVGVFAVRGYNGGGGGFNVVTDPANPGHALITNYEYAPEHVWTYELYGRQELANGRLRLTANLFHSSYRDMQLTYDLTPNDPSDFSFIVKNADRVTTYGAETSATWLVRRGLEVYGSAGLLKAKITSYPNSGFQGNQLPNSPAFTAAAGATWKRSDWDASLSARYASGYYTDIENNPRGKVGNYWLANTQLGYTWNWARIYTSVNNLFDSGKPLAIFSGATSAADSASILQPRSYWVGVQASY